MAGFIKTIKIFFIFSFSIVCFSQSIVDELESDTTAKRGLEEITFAEQIIVSSKSKRIFILSNKNKSLEPGDFVTMLIGGERVVRGLIAKAKEGKSAFKVLKTYDDRAKKAIRSGMTVRLYRGDDSILVKSDNNLQINTEADLFSDKILLDIEDKPKLNSAIKSNNLIQLGFGVYQGIDTSEKSDYYSHWLISWSYKVKEFVWFETLLGYSPAKRFPAEDISTDLYNLTFRVKYNYELPFYSFLMPYAGIQAVIPNSPEAGEGASPDPEGELNLVDESRKIAPILGVTFLKRFVPSWFLTANLGLDVINIGLAIEF